MVAHLTGWALPLTWGNSILCLHSSGTIDTPFLLFFCSYFWIAIFICLLLVLTDYWWYCVVDNIYLEWDVRTLIYFVSLYFPVWRHYRLSSEHFLINKPRKEDVLDNILILTISASASATASVSFRLSYFHPSLHSSCGIKILRLFLFFFFYLYPYFYFCSQCVQRVAVRSSHLRHGYLLPWKVSRVLRINKIIRKTLFFQKASRR